MAEYTQPGSNRGAGDAVYAGDDELSGLWAFADGARGLGRVFWEWGDRRLIDGLMVNGIAGTVGRTASLVRRIQSGLVYHYAFVMIIGLVGLMTWLLFR